MPNTTRFLPFLLFLAGALPAFPQAAVNAGDLQGVVADPAGRFVPGAKVAAQDRQTGLTRSTTTDQSGAFQIPLLPAGEYKVTAEAPGFATKTLEGLRIRVGDAVNITLRLAVSAVTTEVDVTGELPVVETARYQQSTTIERERISNLPINRRNFLDFALLSPGVADTSQVVDGSDYRVAQTPESGLSFGGGNGRGNGFYLDGVENYSNSGGVRYSVSQEAVQEFQINRNSFSSEYGWVSGGTVNIVTRSGSNEIHGNLFGFVRDRSFQARNYFDPAKSAFTRTQAGGTVSGPLRKNKTFIFGSFERLGRNEASFVTILQDRTPFNQFTPSQKQLFDVFQSSNQFLLQALALQAGRLLIPASNPQVLKLFEENSGQFPFAERSLVPSVRLDHRFSDNHTLFVRGNLTRIHQSSAQAGALIGYNRSRGFRILDGTVMAGDSKILSPRWFLETRAMFNYNRQAVVPIDPFGPEINVQGFGSFGRDIFLPAHTYERHYQFIQNWNYHSGTHDWKFGADINPVSDTVRSETFMGGRFGFGEAIPLANLFAIATGDPNFAATVSTILTTLGRADLIRNLSMPINALQAYALGLPTFYQQGFGDPNWVGWSKRQGFFGQYSLQARPGLTVTTGLRYDLEVNPGVLGTDSNNFAPRIAFAWSPAKSGNTVLRGGYGIYYTPTYAQFANVAEALSGKLINQVLVPITGFPLVINTATGRPVTSIDIYQTLLAQNVIGRRAITAADIRQFGLVPAPNLPGRVVFGSDPVVNPYSQQGSLEIERSFGDYAVSLAYNFNRGAHIGRTRGRNLAYEGRLSDGRPTFAKIDPTILQYNVFSYDANSFYHAGILQLSRRLQRGFALSAHYTWSKAIDESTDFNSDFSPHDQLNSRAERALSSFHHAHRIVGNAVWNIPGPGRPGDPMRVLFADWTLAPIVMYTSWRPFNPLTGVDILNDGYITNKRPHKAGRNIGQGPDLFSVDLRLSRRFTLKDSGGPSLEFIAEGFNLFNRTNFRTVNNTVGDIPLESLPNPLRGVRATTSTPLAYTSAGDPRQFQFALKLAF